MRALAIPGAVLLVAALAVSCSDLPTDRTATSGDPALAPQMSRAAVQGFCSASKTFCTSDSQFLSGFNNQGWWAQNTSGIATDNYIVGQLSAMRFFRNFFTFDLSKLRGTVTSAKLELRRFSSSPGNEATETYELFDVSTDAATLNNNTGTNATIFADLGSGTSYGSFAVPISVFSLDEILTFPLNAAAVSDINTAAGGFFSIGGTLTSQDGNDFLFGASGSSEDRFNVNRLVVKVGGQGEDENGDENGEDNNG